MLSVPRAAVRKVPHLYRCVTVTYTVQNRSISSADIFNISKDVSSSVPPAPLPPPPTRTIEEMVAGGESVLEELGLWSPWKPSSYFRVALEGIHSFSDLPWWATIVTATIVLRLALIYVPIMSQKMVAKQSKYKKELAEFREKMDDARKEGNNMLVQQVLMEQRDFLKSKDIKIGRQMLVLLANGAVFATQFFAIKKMIAVNYPGLSTGGTAWFTDLTVADPYYALPLISAATMAIVTRVGIEMGSSTDQMTPAMRLGMQYGLPIVIFIASSQFASGLCVYWCASNMMSLVYAGAFRTPAIRKVFGIPPVVRSEPAGKTSNTFKQVFDNMKAKKDTQPTLAKLRQEDQKRFEKAGRAKPVLKKENQ